jgi:hypothetical protein
MPLLLVTSFREEITQQRYPRCGSTFQAWTVLAECAVTAHHFATAGDVTAHRWLRRSRRPPRPLCTERIPCLPDHLGTPAAVPAAVNLAHKFTLS